jgi:hypothetical protein
VSQPLILRGERSELLTHILATEKRFVVRADEILTAFMELEAAIRGSDSFPHPFTRKKHSSLGEKSFRSL